MTKDDVTRDRKCVCVFFLAPSFVMNHMRQEVCGQFDTCTFYRLCQMNHMSVQQEAHVICLFILALLLLSIANDGEYTESSATRSTLAFSYIACKSLNTNTSTGIWNNAARKRKVEEQEQCGKLT